MSNSNPIPRSRSNSTLILSPRWFDSTALVKLRLEKVVKATYHLVTNSSIEARSSNVSKITINGRDLSVETPETQEQFYELLKNYINHSSYSWKLQNDVVHITLNNCDEDPSWLALNQ